MSNTVLKPVYQWLSGYAVGVHQIDQEHQGLFAVAERMHQAMLEGQGKQHLDALLGELLEYTREHFAHEEQLMERIGYPELSEHRRQHAQLRSNVEAMQNRAVSGETTMTIEAMRFLMEWLKRHTVTSDRRIAGYMTERGLSSES
jgi:hemerythrin-like metal-binding protein